MSALAPYFDSIGGGEAARALKEERLEDALLMFDVMHNSMSDILLTPRARFVAAVIAGELGDDARALKELPELAKELPLVADLANLRAARAAIRLGSCDQAIALARAIPVTSALAPDAALMYANTLRAMGRDREAVTAYRHYRSQYPEGPGREEAESRIVESLSRMISGKEHTAEEAQAAFEMLQHLQAQHPTGYWTREAEAHEATILEALGLKPDEHQEERKAAVRAYEAAAELRKKMKNALAEREYARAIRLARADSALACRARYEQADVVARQRDFERAALLFGATAEDCTDPGIRVRALYRGGKAYQSAGLSEEAIRLFGLVESEYGDHSYADDARLRGATCYLALNDRDKFAEMLSSLPDLYPAGDMRAEALWTLGHDAIVRGELAEARDAFAKYYKLFPIETGWYVAGRSGYWAGRSEELVGALDNAKEHYEQVIASAPLSFYMVLAYNRLAALEKGRAEALIATLTPKGGTQAMHFPKTLLTDFPGLAAGIELQRMGLTSSAKREFNHLLRKPNLTADIHWVIAEVERLNGNFDDARQSAVNGDETWTRRYPANVDLDPWILAYPMAYEDEVMNAADKNHMPPHLIWAVMREESGFNPNIESWANAIGLMQLILPTAKSIGKRLGIEVNRRTLRDPKVNISLGAAYLKHLAALFSDNPVLTVAGYNAGEGAVAKWLKAPLPKDVDLFVEEIPFEQTRGYTKRVISSYATYFFLYGEKLRILEIPMTLP